MRLSDSVREEIAETLAASMADPAASAQLQQEQLVTALAASVGLSAEEQPAAPTGDGGRAAARAEGRHVERRGQARRSDIAEAEAAVQRADDAVHAA